MPVARRIKEILSMEGVAYESIPHKPAHTAQTLAEAEHVSGHEHAKSVIVRTGDELVMFVLPACYNLDVPAVRQLLGEDAQLADEPEFAGRFPDCEVGAIPPFGNLYNLRTFVDTALADDEKITFPAGSFRESLRIPYADFARLVKHETGTFRREPS
jgi:Ala-tRNA(Pro) deacylase